jgi:uncharacterized protein (TIGR02246 family)
MRALPLVVALLGFASAAAAQDPGTAAAPAAAADTPDPAQAAPSTEVLHDELRKLRDDVLAAIQRDDFDAITPHLHPNVVFTPMNGEVCRGPQEIRAYFDKMLKGPDAIVKNIRLDLEVDRLTDLYGNTGLAFGSSNDHYTLNKGMEFPVRTRWTCALVRENGKWLITAFHSSANVFDNPILERAKQGAKLQWGGIGAVAGVLIGALLGLAIGRRRSA